MFNTISKYIVQVVNLVERWCHEQWMGVEDIQYCSTGIRITEQGEAGSNLARFILVISPSPRELAFGAICLTNMYLQLRCLSW